MATGLGAGEPFEIWLHSDPALLATATADDAGVVDTRVTIPVAADAGA